MRLEDENMRAEVLDAAAICLERLRGTLRDDALEAKELIAASKELRALAETIDALTPREAAGDFHLVLTVEGEST